MKLRILATSATLAAASLLANLPAVAATPIARATRALQYLGTQQMADGSIDHSLGETADYALGAQFHGINPNTLRAPSNQTVYDYFDSWLALSVTCATGTNKARDGNNVGKLVQAVVAGGRNPAAFGGRNLLADLEGTGGASGGVYNNATGTFSDCASGGQNAVYAQASAILGLESARNAAYPVPRAATQHLRALQDKSGGWATFGSANTNATALALMALAPLQATCSAPADPLLTAALSYLHTQQDPVSGGFTYSSAFGTASDPDSDALVIQALVAVLQDPAATAWTNSKGSAPADIATFQDPTTGGFKFDHGAGTPVTAFATSEAPAGLDRAPFPDGSAHGITAACPVPSPASPSLPRAGVPPREATPWWPADGGLTLLIGATLAIAARRRRRAG